MYMPATHTKTFRPLNMVSPIFSHYLPLPSPRQTTSPAASTSYGQQGRQTGQNCLLGCGSWASGGHYYCCRRLGFDQEGSSRIGARLTSSQLAVSPIRVFHG